MSNVYIANSIAIRSTTQRLTLYETRMINAHRTMNRFAFFSLSSSIHVLYVDVGSSDHSWYCMPLLLPLAAMIFRLNASPIKFFKDALILSQKRKKHEPTNSEESMRKC